MSDAALSSDNTTISKPRTIYRPEIDGPRMKTWMADQRAAEKAGFSGKTRVRDYRAFLASHLIKE